MPEDMLNVWGHWTTADSEREQSVHISSALVSVITPSHCFGLLARRRTSTTMRYRAPRATWKLTIPVLYLRAGLLAVAMNAELDGQDAGQAVSASPPPIPARYVIDMMRLETDLDCRLWRNEEKSVVMASQVWGHYDEAKRHESSNPERGNQLQASLCFLTAMLAKLDREFGY